MYDANLSDDEIIVQWFDATDYYWILGEKLIIEEPADLAKHYGVDLEEEIRVGDALEWAGR